MAQHVNNIWDFLFDRQDDQKTSMSQEVDYAKYLAEQAAINNATPTATNMSFPVENAQQFNPDQIVSDMPLAPLSDNTPINRDDGLGAMDMMGQAGHNLATSAVDTAWNSQQDQRTPPTPTEEPGFFDKIGSGMSDFFGDEERMARMTIALNSMRLNPDPNIAKSMENKLESIRKRKGANRSVDWLRANATPQNQYAKYADLIEKNPEMASELMKQVMGIGKGGYKTSAVQVDPITGQKYVVKTNPADGSVIREDVEGALGTTYQQEQDIASNVRLKEQDTKDAYKAS